MEESLLIWRLNGKPQPALLCSPVGEEALLTGFLLTGMAVSSPDAIRSLARKGDVWEAVTDGGDGFPDLARRLKMIPGRTAERRIPEDAAAMSVLIRNEGKETGLHTALLFDGADVYTGRDIGRHNALDRAVGKAVMAGATAEGAVLGMTGRISLEMVAKAAAVGICAVITSKQTGSMAAAYAEKWGILLLDPFSL